MSDSSRDTHAMLAKHHRDGEQFAQMMKDSFAGRFNDEFWVQWDRWITPVLGDTPLVLDLGTGPGLFLKALAERRPGVHAVGVEFAPWMLAAVEPLPAGCEIVTADLHDPHLPLEDGSADAALAAVVLHEMHQPVRALHEMRRCLKPGGRLFILDWVRAPLELYLRDEADEARVFDPATPANELDDLFVHFAEHNRFAVGDLAYLLEHTGFDVRDTVPLKEGRFAWLIGEKC